MPCDAHARSLGHMYMHIYVRKSCAAATSQHTRRVLSLSPANAPYRHILSHIATCSVQGGDLGFYIYFLLKAKRINALYGYTRLTRSACPLTDPRPFFLVSVRSV
jgi:hypothetical protein